MGAAMARWHLCFQAAMRAQTRGRRQINDGFAPAVRTPMLILR